MPLPTETGNKKHIIAEGFFESGITESLSKLFISDLTGYRILSVYSDLSNKLMAYKVMKQQEDLSDPWLNASFARTVQMDFNPHFDLIPPQFSDHRSDDLIYNTDPDSPQGKMHYVHGLARHNAGIKEMAGVYLFLRDEFLNIIVLSGRNCLFCNTFSCEGNTEKLYYVLNALQVCGLNQADATLYLDYHLASAQEHKELFRPYFRKVSHMLPDQPHPDPEIPLLPEMLFSNYLLSLCV